MNFWLFSRGIGLALTLSLVLTSQSVLAHPLDISSSTFSIGATSIEATTYLHPSQVEAIIGARGVSMRSLTYGDYYKYSGYLSDYLASKIQVRDKDDTFCTLSKFTTQELGVDEIFTKGFPVSYEVRCPGALTQMKYSISIFRELPLQTNRVLLVDGPSGTPLGYKVLTANITDASFDPANPVKLVDSDGDMLPDEEERVYRTDPAKGDTDRDNYSDYEEVMSGWNPLSPRASLGQKVRDQPSVTPFILPIGILQTAGWAPVKTTDRSSIDNTALAPDASSLDTHLNSASYGLFTRVLKSLETLRSQGWLSLELTLILLGGLFLLGLLHALGPGHSKGFMASYILSSDAGYSRAVLYAGTFTLVHLLDIFVLVFITKFVLQKFDPTSYLADITRYAAFALLGVSIIVLAMAVRALIQKRNISDSTVTSDVSSFRVGLGMAFLSGLAPCTFAWSLLLVLFAIGRFELALPLVSAFGLGVFVSLATIALIVVKFRIQMVARYSSLGLYFPIISSCILLGISILLLTNFY